MKLDKKIRDILSDQRESGMGYQVCEAKMKDGRTFKDILVANGEMIISIAGSTDLSAFNPDEIVSISVSRD
jgi:hypothetical protein